MSPCLYNIYTYRESYSLALRSIPLYIFCISFPLYITADILIVVFLRDYKITAFFCSILCIRKEEDCRLES